MTDISAENKIASKSTSSEYSAEVVIGQRTCNR